jgi:CheY-like chemotaxis protein
LHKKFLLVDDDTDDANLFCEAVSGISPEMQCFTAENGVELFEFLGKHHPDIPDVIFLDINMPLMDGWQCLKKLKESPPFKRIPIIMYSTSSAKRDIFMAYELGVLVFLTKPDDFDELSRILGVVATSSEFSMLGQLKGFRNVK